MSCSRGDRRTGGGAGCANCLPAHPVAVGVNGNLTLVHWQSGRLLLFDPDHDVPDLASWLDD